MPVTTSYVITGIPELYKRINGVSGPVLKRKTLNSLLKSGDSFLKDAIQNETPHRYGGHAGPYYTKGVLERRQKITTKSVRLRSGEIAAVSTKPRVWFEHFVVRGTKAHFIAPKNSSALYFGGNFTGGVHHPGAKPTDYINKAAQGHEQDVLDQLADDLFTTLGF